MTTGRTEADYDSIVFYDLETTGQNPKHHRITQFAGVRMTPDLNDRIERLAFYVQPGEEVIPEPRALVLSRVSPVRLRREGITEAEAAEKIAAFFGRPGTLRCGWNSIAYDDEMVRQTLWRSLRNPYGPEWRGGNSRMDIQTLYRAASVAEPGLIAEWPLGSRGRPTYNLGRIAAAAGVQVRGNLHDAGEDTEAVVQLAQRLRFLAHGVWRHGIACTAGRKTQERAIRNADGGLWLLAEHGRAPALCGCRLLAPTGHSAFPGYRTFIDVGKEESPAFLAGADEETVRGWATRTENGRRSRPLPIVGVPLTKSPYLVRIAAAGSTAGPGAATLTDALARLGDKTTAAEAAKRAAHVAANQAEYTQSCRVVARTDADARSMREADGRPKDVERLLYDGFPADTDYDEAGMLRDRLTGADEWEPPSPDELRRRVMEIRDVRLRTLTKRYAARWHGSDPAVPGEWIAQWQEHVRSCRSEGFGDRPSAAGFLKALQELRTGGAEHDAEQLAILDELQQEYDEHYTRNPEPAAQSAEAGEERTQPGVRPEAGSDRGQMAMSF